MSDNARLRAAASLIVGLLLAGCDGATLCRECEKPPPAPDAPDTIKVDVDWKKLAAALKEAGVGSTTVTTETVNMTVNPGQPPSRSNTVKVEGWNQLVEALEATPTVSQNTGGSKTTHHIHLSTFAFRFAPPWFNADQRSLFTSYVVFPVEAKFEEWIASDPEEKCGQGAAPSVCPDAAFYEEAMTPFLKGLSQCATTKKVELHLLGFASSTELREPLEEESVGELNERYDAFIADITAGRKSCRGENKPEAPAPESAASENKKRSNRFNLLIANQRAANAAEMLEGLVPDKPENAIAIEAIPWCSHADMVKERRFEDDGDPAKGLMNRRVEVRVATLPGCLNVEPDKRMPTTPKHAKAAEAT